MLTGAVVTLAAGGGHHGLLGVGRHGLRAVVLVVVLIALVVALVALARHWGARRPSASARPAPGAGPDQATRRPKPTATFAAPQTPPAPLRRDRDGIEARGLSKHYGAKAAVEDLSFEVKPGRVTGFLGPNGAGKSTTMRLIMGLDAPDHGSVTINGLPYHHLAWPLREVGALLEANAVHPGRRAVDHLWMLARTNQIPRTRVDEVLEVVGLSSVADQRAGQFSLGMSQRLGIAVALLGDPGVLLFDEPMNGLDTDGIRWVRHLLRNLAREGRTVFVSSHLMSEMALLADHVVVIGKGRLIAEMPISDFTSQNAQSYVRVRSPQLEKLRRDLEHAGASTEGLADESLAVRGMSKEEIGKLAWEGSIMLHELSPQLPSLEEAFVESTESGTDYRGSLLRTGGNEKGDAA